jgi:3-hydroxybutyryl-CoA dehydrogenase
MQIAIAGPGLMGSQIGVEYALGGHDVTFLARSPDAGRERVEAALDAARSLRLWDEAALQAADARLAFAPAVANLSPETEIFVESIDEDAHAKIDLLKEVAARMPNAILASNTSSLSIGRLGGWAGTSKRTLGTHYWNPPLLMPLVEVVAGPETDHAHVETMTQVLRDLGKRPVLVSQDVDGFVWNRLQLALLREAVWIVEHGVATPEVVDEIVRDGLARRWRYTGPFETAALGGAETFTRVAHNLWPELSHATELHDLGKWLLDDPKRLDTIRQRRDAGLIDDLTKDRADDA